MSVIIKLFFFFKSEKDILLRNELDELAKKHPDQFKVWYTVDKASEGEFHKIDYAVYTYIFYIFLFVFYG